MASTIGLLPEKHFLCHLCMDIFISPVTIPCGHSFCKTCLCQYWTRHQSYCPQCKRVFTQRPGLSVNRILADVSDNFRKSRPEKTPVEEMVDVEQLIQERLQKIERIKCSLQLLKTSCHREVRESQRVFSALVNAMEKSHKAVVVAIEDRQREEEKRVEKFVKELEKEIMELRRSENNESVSELHDDEGDDEKKGITSSPNICLSNMKDWSKVTIEADPCLGLTRRALSEEMDKIRGEVNRLCKSELKRIEKYSVDINLSPKTAHPALCVSDDRKEVRHTDKLQEVPENPRRFDRVANTLGKESFSGGRYYWEVEVGEKIEWSLGVVRQSVNRKGKFTVCPANGYWTVSLKPGGQYVANTLPVTPLALGQKPTKIGVFLDYRAGHVSFYCVDTGVHIHTFMDTFSDRLHPFFSPGRLYSGKNTAPLKIISSCCSI